MNLFKNNKIKYTDIYKIIKVTSIKLYSSVNTIKDIISYHEDIEIYYKNQRITLINIFFYYFYQILFILMI